MDNFNMKQWLQENKVGPYSKTLLREGARGAQEGFLKDLDDIQLTHNGKEYDLVVQATYEYTVGSDIDPRTHPDDPIPSTVYDVDVMNIDPKILELYRLEDGEYLRVTDPAEIQEVEIALKTDEGALKRIEDFILGYDIDLDNYDEEPEMDETVGYVMKTKPADLEKEF